MSGKQENGFLRLILTGSLFIISLASCSLRNNQGTEAKDIVQPSSTARVTVDTVGRLTGVNWFGFETGNFVVHGLWTRDYKSMLKQIKDLGFNCLRLPWCNDMIPAVPSGIQINPYGVDAYTGVVGMNVDLAGLTSIQVFDKIIEEAGRQGLKIILDNHSLLHDDYMNETLWYNSTYPESRWISDWVYMINRYKSYANVVAADLKNEPHGNMTTGMKPPATWGYTATGYTNTDWKGAAERCSAAILQANPGMIIIVEGVEEYKGDYYWWGGNLKGVVDYPITTISKSQLMYSAHEYGPEVYLQSWFTNSTFPANMPAIWDTHFWFIYKQALAPLFFGEFGIKEESAANPTSTAYIWFTTFMAYVGGKSHWTFWCMNPNSGDTGGILKDDWVTVNTAKYGLLKPYLAPQFSVSSSSAASLYISSASSVSSSKSSVSSAISSAVSSIASSVSSSKSSVASSAVSSAVSSTASSASTAGGLKVQFFNGNLSSTVNMLYPRFKLVNTGVTAVSLSTVKIRYYYTIDGEKTQNFWCDWSTAGSANVTGTFVKMTTAKTNADYYLEVGFTTAAGNINPGAAVEVQTRAAKTDWSNYLQTNDYSFNPTSTSFIDWTKVTAYISGVLKWGVEP